MSIIFTTAFRDIGRKLWTGYYTRTNETYFDSFVNLASNIQYKLVVYVENDVKDALLQKCSFGDHIIFVDLKTVNTFYDQFLDLDREIISSEKYKSLIPEHRSAKPPHNHSEYNMINHSKVSFLHNTHILYQGYEYYAWIDFGSINADVANVPKTINFNMLSPKIIYHCLQLPPAEIKNEVDMLDVADVYLTGSSFIVHRNLVGEFETLYRQKIIEWQSKGITDDDQRLIFQIYYDRPDLFQLIVNPEWYTLYRMISN